MLDAGGGAVVVANGAEGEPASAKDAALLQHRPHLVLDGLMLAAEALGAERAVVWLHAGATATHRAVVLAARRTPCRATGSDCRSSVVTGPGPLPHRGVQRGRPGAVRRPRAAAVPPRCRPPRSGVGGRPTLVHNVETLARVAVVARTGAAGYRPTSLVTVVGRHARVVLEVDPAAPSRTWSGRPVRRRPGRRADRPRRPS